VGLGLGSNFCFFSLFPSSWPLKQGLISVLKFLMFGLFDKKGVKVCEDFYFGLLKGGA